MSFLCDYQRKQARTCWWLTKGPFIGDSQHFETTSKTLGLFILGLESLGNAQLLTLSPSITVRSSHLSFYCLVLADFLLIIGVNGRRPLAGVCTVDP